MDNFIVDTIEKIDDNCCGKECTGHVIRHAIKQLSIYYLEKFKENDEFNFSQELLHEMIHILFLSLEPYAANSFILEILHNENASFHHINTEDDIKRINKGNDK